MVSFSSNRMVVSGLLVLLTLAVLLGITLAKPLLVGANGRVLELTRHIAGPYEIAAGTIPGSPVVGAFHMTMNVIDIANNLPIIDAEITVTAVGPLDPENPESGPAQLGPLSAANSPTDPIFYDINTVVEREGVWVFTIDVSADLGEATTEFPVEVGKPNPITGIVTLVTLLVFVTILGLSVRTFLRERGKRRQSRGNA